MKQHTKISTRTKTMQSVQLGSNLNLLLALFGFFSKEDSNDYYVSLEDDQPYYSLTEKE